MSEGALVLFLVGPVVLLLCLVLAQLAGTGRIARNSAVGIRTRSTLSSDEAWRAGHLAARWPALIAVVVTIIAGAVVVLTTASTTITTVLSVAYAALLVALIAWLVVTANRAARAAETASSHHA